MFSSRDLVDVAWAIAKAGLSSSPLFDALASAAEQMLDDPRITFEFSQENLADAVSAFSTSGLSNTTLSAVLTRAAERYSCDGAKGPQDFAANETTQRAVEDHSR
eukprot:gnl/TRDRNA2_/TRDRNA2_155396_c0_seq2.p3 gnl/TRDRNA2_/TRDRNA2_155396_c0~~gnl/TRDRNA2_/TRDRNA2_155396_c0_seq2.p3  ORF type:complete len:105 (+),score=12.99 gnl/TRDRNA2_/TRDRNA2_155396_c0_seq2:440-754(+)